MSGTSSRRTVRFGGFEFDFASGELRNNRRKIPLQSQPAQVLSQLLTNPGQVVTRDDLRRTVWTDETFVDFEAAVNVAINKVRTALGDSATAPRFIETIPKRGYRFLADVHDVEAAAASAAVTAPALRAPMLMPRRSRWIAAAALGVVVLAVYGGANVRLSSAPPRSIAVLPFRPLASQNGDPALEVGLAEAVIVRLGQLKQLRVPSIHAVQRYAKADVDPLMAGRELDVDAVLDGSLMRAGGSVRLSARLLNVKTGATLWAQQWDFPWTDIFGVQDTMAGEVTRALALTVVPAEQTSMRTHPTNVAAYEGYLRARSLLLRRTIHDSRRAAELLEEVVRVDPDSARAHASLAFAYISVPLSEGPTVPYVELGRRAVRRALDLDPTIAEAHSVMARILMHFDWDAEGSDRESRRALELEPSNPFVHHCYSLMLADQGRFDEAIALADRALALDPASLLANRDKGIILYLSRRYEEGAAQGRKTIELDRYYGPAYGFLGRVYEQLDRPADAVDAYLTPFTFHETNRDMVAALRAAAAERGLRGFWALRLHQLLQQPHVPAASVAGAYVRLGDHENALRWLERLHAERGAWIRGLKADPGWDPLRGDARFKDLLRRSNLGAAPTLPSL